eukprot:TRINITY_DN1_c0_g1_i4.p1 TRINITY_DN1_c0_g1~~TRINITY_DN1_c0_g1_i4.p1  ORF type:complete len:440 (-),score=-87.06 TRINITY_DN1_c0_g1_i4:446-1765(-)
MSSWERSACYPRSTFYPLSDGPSIQNRRITMTYFRTCSTCWSRSQAPLCHCTLRPVSNRPEGTFARLRYSLGGDRPSQTTRLTLFPRRIHGGRLEFKQNKGGISTMTPPMLAHQLHSLPPILHMQGQVPMVSYSKGSRGLSVPLRVSGIFTATTISPSSWLRQCPDRYTIRAGRNLPDKEFRYLRTVIVTAAVYWGFNSMLRFNTNISSQPSSTGQVSGLILHLSILQSHVFLLNSRLGHFSAPYSRRDPFSRSYRVNLPSSLAVNHSSTFGYSPRPPVSVSGTGSNYLKLREFSWKYDQGHYPLVRRLTVLSSFSTPGGFASQRYTYTLQRTIPSVRRPFTPSSSHRSNCQQRNINLLSIDVSFRMCLRTRLTLIRLALIRKPQSFGEGVSHPLYRYLYLHLLFHTLQQSSRFTFNAEWNAPLPVYNLMYNPQLRWYV